MSAETKFDGIPEELQPLFHGSARDALSAATDMISEATEKDQQSLLEDDVFCKAVNSALFELDQRSSEVRIEVTALFHKKNQPLAFKTFIGRSN